MSDKFHINPETGNPGKCRAMFRCRFGGNEDHYATPEDARTAFETQNEHIEVPSALRDARKLEEVAYTTKKIKEMRIVVEHGSDIALRVLAQNPNTPSDLLAAALDKATNPSALAQIALHKNFPLSELNEKAMDALVVHGNAGPGTLRVLLKSDEITDKQAFIVAEKHAFWGASAILDNPDNKVTQEGMEALAKTHHDHMMAAVENPRFDTAKFLSEDPAPAETLSRIARTRGLKKETLKFVYDHPKTPQVDKEDLKRRFESGYFDN